MYVLAFFVVFIMQVPNYRYYGGERIYFLYTCGRIYRRIRCHHTRSARIVLNTPHTGGHNLPVLGFLIICYVVL